MPSVKIMALTGISQPGLTLAKVVWNGTPPSLANDLDSVSVLRLFPNVVSGIPELARGGGDVVDQTASQEYAHHSSEGAGCRIGVGGIVQDLNVWDSEGGTENLFSVANREHQRQGH